MINAFIKKEFMRYLNSNTCTITCIIFATTGSAVLHILKYGKRIRYYLVAFIAFDISNKAYPA